MRYQMTRDILEQYINLNKECVEVEERIRQTERQLAEIEKGGTVIDSVSGGLGGTQHFKIEGFPIGEYTRKKNLLLSRQLVLLNLNIQILEMTTEIEKFICGINDSFIRRIIDLRVMRGLSWNDVAAKMGYGNTEDSIKKAYYRYVDGQNLQK